MWLRLVSIRSVFLLKRVFLFLLQLIGSLLELFFVPETVVFRVELQLRLQSVLFKLRIDTRQQLFGFLASWIVVFVDDVSYLNPFFE